MRATAAVVNAGLGDLSLGLEMAGFEVVAAFEPDKKAVALHGSNIKAPVYPLSLEEIDVKQFPEVDLVAAHIRLSGFSSAAHTLHEDYDSSAHVLHEILFHCHPRAVFLLFNPASMRKNLFQEFLYKSFEEQYQFQWRVIDVAEATGFPVKERMVCVVGILREEGKNFYFPACKYPAPVSLENYLQLDQHPDSWYFRDKFDGVPQYEGTHQLFCWKKNAYAGVDRIQWNFRKIPLVRDFSGLRRITHREVANLKGFPKEYELPERDKMWLYQKLMYVGNVPVIKSVAEMIFRALQDNPWRVQKREYREHFEELFGRYLQELENKGVSDFQAMAQDFPVNGRIADFAVGWGDRDLFFEVKHYNGRFAPNSAIKAACEQLSFFSEFGESILVLANEIPERIRNQCLSQFGVSIWDVGNLLWLFDEFSDIKNEFIASLDYAVNNIDPQPPVPSLFQKTSESSPKKEPGWKEKLEEISPDRDDSQRYESVCTEIIKYALGDYLTLWSTQKSSNGGLYRFDLICKIKNGVNQDFFDTLKHYFNTKYIVFEFKNYSKKISQKEIYTTEKYLYEKALRKVAIIISRSGADEHALKAARGSLRETGKLIMCFSDDELLEMVNIKARGEQEPAEFLAAALDDLLVDLEK